MDEYKGELQHFLLTRFNILLWTKDKEGNPVRTIQWLEHRFSLFEKYCLPSVKNQTCQDFEWIILFDSKTPEKYKEKIESLRNDYPQIIPVYVKPEYGRFFADIFRMEMEKRLKAKRVISTYLDNDDALNCRFVEDLHKRVPLVGDGTFFYYDEGCQYYTEGEYMMRIHYPRNHFVSVVESADPASVKGIFGYGGHYYINTINGAKIERIKNLPMWCEVVHEKNMLNDANFLLGTNLIHDRDYLRKDFGVDAPVNSGLGIYVFRFFPRYIKTFIKRARHRLFGRQW